MDKTEMNMNVKIIEAKSGKVIANVPVNLRALNYTPSEREYFSLAWESAVEDGDADEKCREDYTFKLAPLLQVG